ncbi:MAG: hypothetical protein AAB434_13345 [Planctomycetota bacterium]
MSRTLILATVLCTLGAVRADVVHLKNGGTVEGIVTEEADAYMVQTAYGTTRIKKEEVERVERSVSQLERYRETAAKLGDEDAKGWFELGQWAKASGLDPQSHEAFTRVLTIDPDHAGAREALGFVRHEGQWLDHDAWMDARGWIKVGGKWVSPEAAALMKALAEKEALQAQADAAEAKAREAESRAKQAEADAERAALLREAKAEEARAAEARAVAAREEAERARALREARWAELEIERLRHSHCPVCGGHEPGGGR